MSGEIGYADTRNTIEREQDDMKLEFDILYREIMFSVEGSEDRGIMLDDEEFKSIIDETCDAFGGDHDRPYIFTRVKADVENKEA